MKQILILKSEKISTLKSYIYFFNTLAFRLNISLKIFWQPKKKYIFSLLKSPHVNKKSKEHYGTKFFSCILIFDNFYNFFLFKKILKNKPAELACKLILKN